MDHENAAIDLRETRSILQCTLKPASNLRERATIRHILKRIIVIGEDILSEYDTDYRFRISRFRTRSQETIRDKRREVIKLMNFCRRALMSSPRYLPFRGVNTLRNRGALRRETREELQERVLPRFQSLIPTTITFMTPYMANFDNPVVAPFDRWTIKFDDLDAYRDNLDDILLFDVSFEQDIHYMRGMLFPAQDNHPRYLVYINTWWLDEPRVSALFKSYKDLFAGLGIDEDEDTFITVLPNDIGMSPQRREELVRENPVLDRQIQKFKNLQELDESCRGVGQCQHWTFMTAYVFLKEYAALVKRGYESTMEFKLMCNRVWRILEQAEPLAGFNALQREMNLLGGYRLR